MRAHVYVAEPYVHDGIVHEVLSSEEQRKGRPRFCDSLNPSAGQIFQPNNQQIECHFHIPSDKLDIITTSRLPLFSAHAL